MELRYQDEHVQQCMPHGEHVVVDLARQGIMVVLVLLALAVLVELAFGAHHKLSVNQYHNV